MDNRQAYNSWADTYDTVQNKTRDIESKAINSVLANEKFETVLEIGCGTGKNTEWLGRRSKHMIAVDFSDQMLNRAKQKISSNHIEFIQADITKDWKFTTKKFDLVTCSLILEHVENIDFIFHQAVNALNPNGYFYAGELHPFKQYRGSKARFETHNGTFELRCFVHHISDYYQAAFKNNFDCIKLNEWFDDDDTTVPPRLVSFLFRKKYLAY